MEKTKPKLRPDAVLASRPRDKTPPAKEWQPFRPGCEPGHYYTEDLNATRAELHRSGIAPRVLLSGKGIAKALILKGAKGDIVIHLQKREALICEEVACRVTQERGRELQYHGQSIGAFMDKAVTALVLSPRKDPPAHGDR